MIRIVTDSGAHLPLTLREQFRITVVPLYVIFGTKTYRDEIDLSTSQFYYMLQHEKAHPGTAAASPADFVAKWRPLLDADDEIVSVHLPSRASATYSSAVTAKAQLDAERGMFTPITVVDSKWVSMGMGFQAIAGARAAAEGKTREEVAAAMAGLDSHMTVVFLLDTLEYVRRGGRIGNAQAFLGTMFNIKPLLQFVDGGVEPLERARSRKAGMKRLIELVSDPPTTSGPRVGSGPLHVTILHANAENDAQYLVDELRARFNLAELYLTQIGPAIGVHTGPQALGLIFYRE
jgi:DegV family protein with EDD domain